MIRALAKSQERWNSPITTFHKAELGSQNDCKIISLKSLSRAQIQGQALYQKLLIQHLLTGRAERNLLTKLVSQVQSSDSLVMLV